MCFTFAAPPHITLIPPKQVVHPGQNAFINCTTTGEKPISIEWLPIGRNMPSSVYTRDGYIRFNNIQLQDAGRYLCRASNNAGVAEATADVIVEGKPEDLSNQIKGKSFRLLTQLQRFIVLFKCHLNSLVRKYCCFCYLHKVPMKKGF